MGAVTGVCDWRGKGKGVWIEGCFSLILMDEEVL